MKPLQAIDVFVSFATADKSVAQTVVTALEARKISCWFCPRPEQNLPGEQWAASISEALRGCQAMVLLYSAAAGASKYVQREIAMAFELQKAIITVRLDSAPLVVGSDYLFAGTQFLDGVGNAPDGWLPTLISSLGNYVVGQDLFPLDSILHRDLKVTASEIIIDAFFRGQRVALLGIGLGLNTSVAGCKQTSHRQVRILELVRNDLSRCVQLSSQKEYGVFTIESKENHYLLVGVAEATNTSAVQQAKARLLHIACAVAERCAGQVGVCQREMQTETLSPSRAQHDHLAEFFTSLGRRTQAASPALAPAPADPHGTESTAEDVDPELRTALRKCILQVRRSGLHLPMLFKQDAAESFMSRLVSHAQ